VLKRWAQFAKADGIKFIWRHQPGGETGAVTPGKSNIQGVALHTSLSDRQQKFNHFQNAKTALD